MARFNLEDYATVEERLKVFWSTCDDARIVTGKQIGRAHV